jgi:DNA adenine methylase
MAWQVLDDEKPFFEVEQEARYEGDVYLDPPYWETEGYGVPFPYSEYVEIAVRLRSLKGRPIVSLNDHPDVRRAFDGFHIETVDIKYTVGGGREAVRKEVIIFSWDDARQPAGLF